MPFRSRIKRAFTFGSEENGRTFGKSKSSTWPLKTDPRLKDPNVYQPGEKMPPLKYRRPVNPEHKAMLEAYSWSTAWRRRSEQSQYSPMGSRMPSRRSSRTTLGRRSMDYRNNSKGDTMTTGVDSGFGGSISGDLDRIAQVREGSDEETTPANVGLSRPPTNEVRSSSTNHRLSTSLLSIHRSPSAKSSSSRPQTSERSLRRSGSSRIDRPFTPEDLELALKRQFGSTKEGFDESGNGTPTVPVEVPSVAA